MVLAIEASDENVEDTQRRDFSQGCAWRLVKALSFAARSELPRKWQILARLVTTTGAGRRLPSRHCLELSGTRDKINVFYEQIQLPLHLLSLYTH
jgi:hypothetical protein